MSEVKLYTQAEWDALLEGTGLTANNKIERDLRERGLIAPGPVDPLLEEAEALHQEWLGKWMRGGSQGDAIDLALAALRRGMELRPELTREMVREAVVVSLDRGDMIEPEDFTEAQGRYSRGCAEDFVTRLHAALTGGDA